MQLFLLTTLVFLIFASNTLLCRAALVSFGMEPLCYTALRALSAAAMLALLCLTGRIRGASAPEHGETVWKSVWRESSWPAALFLFGYMFFFSLAFVRISSAAGTLVLNVSVQVGMVGFGLWQGVRMGKGQVAGFAIALGGLVLLVGSSLTVPSPWHALLIGLSGLSWAGFCLAGARVRAAAAATAGNFLRCVPLGLLTLCAAFAMEDAPPLPGALCALAAGGIASSLGYILWYSIQPRYDLVSCSIIQLAVPVMTALLAVPVLAEPITLRLVICSGLILGGIALAVLAGHKPNTGQKA